MSRFREPGDRYIVGVFGKNNNNRKILERYVLREFNSKEYAYSKVSLINGSDTVSNDDLSACTHLYTADMASLDVLKNHPNYYDRVMYSNIVDWYIELGGKHQNKVIAILLKNGHYDCFAIGE